MPSKPATSNRPPMAAPQMTQPEEMRTRSYVYGVDKLNGYDAWALFKASAVGDMPKATALLAKDPRLVNAQYWYQFPIHMAVRGGHAGMVELLLDRGADPGQSRFTYDSWDKLLLCAKERGHRRIESLLQRAMQDRFNYSPHFGALKEAIIARDPKKIGAVLRRQPDLVRAADELGNNALHWSVITRQLELIARFVTLGAPIDAQRADGNTPVLLAASGANDYWHRTPRGKSHPSIRNAFVLVGSLLAHGAYYDLSVACAAGDQERALQLLKKDAGLARKLNSARCNPLTYAASEGHLHIARTLLEHGADPNMPEDLAPNGAALFEACRRNDIAAAELLLKHGANPNAGVDSCGCCLTIGKVYHGARAKPIQDLLRSHGAFTPPYAMSVKELKQALRDGHPATRHEEFAGCVFASRDAELLNLFLKFTSRTSSRLSIWSGSYPKSAPFLRKLLARGLDPDNPDWLGRTFLHFCAANGDLAIAKVFLDAGADINARDVDNETPLSSAIRNGRGKVAELLKQRGGK